MAMGVRGEPVRHVFQPLVFRRSDGQLAVSDWCGDGARRETVSGFGMCGRLLGDAVHEPGSSAVIYEPGDTVWTMGMAGQVYVWRVTASGLVSEVRAADAPDSPLCVPDA